MQIVIIVAYSKNRVIGRKGQIPWHIRTDLQLFKKLTLNHTIIMGRNTFESIGKPLPQRENIVLSRQGITQEDIISFPNIEMAMNYCQFKNKKRIFCVGGGMVYEQILPRSTHLFISEVDTWISDGDTFFPKVNFNHWKCLNKIAYCQNDRDDYSFIHSQWERK